MKALMIGLTARARTGLAILVSAAALAVAMPVAAQEVAPEHLAMARQYVDLTDRSAIYEVALVETAMATMNQIVSQNPAIADETNSAIESVLQAYADQKGDLLDQFARVYAVRFSMEELEQIVEFYRSDVGQKLAGANAEVNQDLQRVMRVFEANLRQEFFARVRAELRASGVEL